MFRKESHRMSRLPPQANTSSHISAAGNSWCKIPTDRLRRFEVRSRSSSPILTYDTSYAGEGHHYCHQTLKKPEPNLTFEILEEENLKAQKANQTSRRWSTTFGTIPLWRSLLRSSSVLIDFYRLFVAFLSSEIFHSFLVDIFFH